MFPGNPRESVVAALQLANGDTEKVSSAKISFFFWFFFFFRLPSIAHSRLFYLQNIVFIIQ
jgi:hypothetical protein